MASRINQNWVFGRSARLDFSTTPPTASAGTLISTLEGCASISDASGTLLLYSDGRTVWDGGGTVRASGLQGNSSSTQSAIIVPAPGSASRYYVFTADGATGGNNHFNGVLIDTATWAPAVPLSSLMTMPSTAGLSATEKVTAVQHRNCRDFWVITVVTQGSQNGGPGIFRIFRVDAAGVQHVSDTPMGAGVNDVGYLKASGSGARLALASSTSAGVLVYPFDNATGAVNVAGVLHIPSPPVPVPDHPRTPYGVEFSPNGNVLYFTLLGQSGATTPLTQGFVFQHDLLGSSPSLLLGMHPNAGGRYALGALQRGMDNRIYVAQDGESRLGVIANPDVLGPGCGLAFNAIALPGNATCFLGLPNLIGNPCECACKEGNCDHAVDEANRVLNRRADRKFFTIPALGQPAVRDCAPAFEQRDFAPLFSLHWGDGPTDQFESHDTEVVYIRVRNPYRNLLFRGVKIFEIRITPNQVLPDGENALRLIPEEIVCFDEVGPCSHVSRDFAFLIQNAVVQGYQITFRYCIEETVIVDAGNGRVAFDIDVVAS